MIKLHGGLMFSEVLKIKPQLDNSDLNKMETTLNARFKRVAKRFGGGIMNVIKGGGVVGGLMVLIDKILNPLKEVQEAMDRMLNTADDIATNAKQFDTSTGKLAKLVQLAKASGLDQDGLFTLLNKFQNAVAVAKADPASKDRQALGQFLDEKDIADSFFSFIQALKQMDKSQQLLVQQQIFGEKQVLKMSEFLNQDFAGLMKTTGLSKVSSKGLGGGIEKMASLNDLAAALKVRTETQDWMNKSKIINEGMVYARNESERIALERENQRIASYQNLAAISQTTDNIMKLVEQGVGYLGGLITFIKPKIDQLIGLIQKVTESKFFRSLMGGK